MLIWLSLAASFRAVPLTQVSIATGRNEVASAPTAEPEELIPVPCEPNSINRAEVFLLHVELLAALVYIHVGVDTNVHGRILALS